MKHDPAERQTLDPEFDWSALMRLARCIRLDPDSGALVIQNGAARLVLGAEGTLRIEGVRLIQTAERDITLLGATINLN